MANKHVTLFHIRHQGNASEDHNLRYLEALEWVKSRRRTRPGVGEDVEQLEF
jgi:hypothetical protein